MECRQDPAAAKMYSKYQEVNNIVQHAVDDIILKYDVNLKN